MCRWMSFTTALLTAVCAAGCRQNEVACEPAEPASERPVPATETTAASVPPTAAISAPTSDVPRVSLVFWGPANSLVSWNEYRGATTSSRLFDLPYQLDNVATSDFHHFQITMKPNASQVAISAMLEVMPFTPRLEKHLAGSAIPVELVEEDLVQSAAGVGVTNVIYLPDEEFRSPEKNKIESIRSLETPAGEDPIITADRRGSILAVLRYQPNR